MRRFPFKDLKENEEVPFQGPQVPPEPQEPQVPHMPQAPFVEGDMTYAKLRLP